MNTSVEPQLQYAPQDQRAAEVVSAMGNLAGRNKLGPDSAAYGEIARLAPAANKKAPVYASIQEGVLDLYGKRQTFDAVINDARSESPDPETTLKTFTGFAKKIKTHIAITPELETAFQQARAERAALGVSPVRTSGSIVDVNAPGNFVRSSDDFHAPARGTTADKFRE